jgi:hypothetical protein
VIFGCSFRIEVIRVRRPSLISGERVDTHSLYVAHRLFLANGSILTVDSWRYFRTKLWIGITSKVSALGIAHSRLSVCFVLSTITRPPRLAFFTTKKLTLYQPYINRQIFNFLRSAAFAQLPFWNACSCKTTGGFTGEVIRVRRPSLIYSMKGKMVPQRGQCVPQASIR